MVIWPTSSKTDINFDKLPVETKLIKVRKGYFLRLKY